ncbi:hypothetical protein D7V93_16885 [Corallococcus llansteffanensis]|uniref:Uncharacterized protein n=2 Tax=Corallococcus llansteffanensis TaxID=2316731 RepID=A0A3A8PQL2_9BACT|nr:hypothetical protein D7V93_16885 [Corallococcus llansteffanensis]
MAASFLMFPLMACTTAKATAFALPMERATECRSLCEQIDMKLGAVVIIMNSAGCVCEPKSAEGMSPAVSGAAAAAGGALIQANAEVNAEESRRREAARQESSQGRSPGTGPGPSHH